MHILYLGEYSCDSLIVERLREHFPESRIDHLTAITLDFGHIHMNPLPDVIFIKCDFSGVELDWARRYAGDIPKIFIMCPDCLDKSALYASMGYVFDLRQVYDRHDIAMNSLAIFIREVTHHE